MTKKDDQARAARLAAALRDNLRKRKARSPQDGGNDTDENVDGENGSGDSDTAPSPHHSGH